MPKGGDLGGDQGEGSARLAKALAVRRRNRAGRKRRFIDAFRETLSIEASCRYAGVTRQSMMAWRAEDPEFRADLEVCLEAARFEVEGQLMELVRKGDRSAIMYAHAWLRKEAEGKPAEDDLATRTRRLWEQLGEFVPAPASPESRAITEHAGNPGDPADSESAPQEATNAVSRG